MSQTPSSEPRLSSASASASTARYRWRLLRAGPLLLDGGSMFGIIPRVVWSKVANVDELGRISVAHNCLLLESTATSAKPQYVLIETGSGDKFDEKNRRIFGLSDRSIIDALSDVGVACEDIGHVIVSHLHFDHGGGLTRRAPIGETPNGAPPANAVTSAKITFPNADIFVQRREWDDALANNSAMTRTYLRENLEPIRGKVKLLNSPPPFEPGYHPQREEAPQSPPDARATRVLPGIDVFLVPGHTWGQQAIRFVDDRGRTVVFSADLIPTVNHVGSAYNMAYDVEPFTSTVTRRWFLAAAAENDWLLVLDHEPGNPCQRVRRDGKGWFVLQPEESHL